MTTTPASKRPGAKTASARPAARPATRSTAASKSAAKPVATKAAPKAKPAKVSPKAYILLTGIDDEVFCSRVSEKLKDGYELFGSPSVTFNGKNVIAAQALVHKKGKKHKK